jgi:hypothetical protein
MDRCVVHAAYWKHKKCFYNFNTTNVSEMTVLAPKKNGDNTKLDFGKLLVIVTMGGSLDSFKTFPNDDL